MGLPTESFDITHGRCGPANGLDSLDHTIGTVRLILPLSKPRSRVKQTCVSSQMRRKTEGGLQGLYPGRRLLEVIDWVSVDISDTSVRRPCSDPVILVSFKGSCSRSVLRAAPFLSTITTLVCEDQQYIASSAVIRYPNTNNTESPTLNFTTTLEHSQCVLPF